MIRMTLLAAALALALAGPAAAQVHKCEVNGQTVYQGTPCPQESAAAMESGTVSAFGGGIDLEYQREMRERVAEERRKGAAYRRQAQARYEERKAQAERERQARRSGIVAEGMSESDAIRMYGSPDRTNISQSGGGTCKFHYWDNPRRRVMVCDGQVADSYAQGVD